MAKRKIDILKDATKLFTNHNREERDSVFAFCQKLAAFSVQHTADYGLAEVKKALVWASQDTGNPYSTGAIQLRLAFGRALTACDGLPKKDQILRATARKAWITPYNGPTVTMAVIGKFGLAGLETAIQVLEFCAASQFPSMKINSLLAKVTGKNPLPIDVAADKILNPEPPKDTDTDTDTETTTKATTDTDRLAKAINLLRRFGMKLDAQDLDDPTAYASLVRLASEHKMNLSPVETGKVNGKVETVEAK
jgi:hypothetical protein